MTITIDNLSWGAGRGDILHDITLHVRDGETVGLVGPNGSGKSSLLRLIAGLRSPRTGTVRYNNTNIHAIPARERARAIAFVEQTIALSVEMTVADIVRLGRIPHRRRFTTADTADRDIVDAAIATVGLTEHRDQIWSALSGGEQQRTHLARAIAQQPDCLILDEPTNHLDIKHQLDILHLIATTPATTIVALHDLTHTTAYCDRVIVLDAGRIVADGPPETTLSPSLIRTVFTVQAHPAHTASGHNTLAFNRIDHDR
jgi:iron complex transport system ATP-binding protein